MKGQGDGLAMGWGWDIIFYEKALSLIMKIRVYGGLGLGPLRVKWRNPTARPSAKQRHKKLQKKR